jgi:hypothetical protein
MEDTPPKCAHERNRISRPPTEAAYSGCLSDPCRLSADGLFDAPQLNGEKKPAFDGGEPKWLRLLD